MKSFQHSFGKEIPHFLRSVFDERFTTINGL